MSKELKHYGILGQKRGIRRYQNEDGSLTEEGKIRYGYKGTVRNTGEKEYAKDRRKRIKAELEAISRSKWSNREKARALSELGDHENSAKYYQKIYANARRARRISNVAYGLGALAASKIMYNKVSKGKMTFQSAARVGRTAYTGKLIVDAILKGQMANSAANFNKEYWKPNK